jgi:TPP-dependent pyruvate/acetoin dehydrogenase alpha subunit
MKEEDLIPELTCEALTDGYNKDIDINGFSDCELSKFLEQLLLVRLVEQKLAFEKKEGVIRGPIHLAAGQEAIAVGISKELRKTDRIFGTHRSHPHILSMGCEIDKFFAEILGKATGLSKGMGGSMHLIDEKNGFMGSVPIVAGTVPIALGAALAEKYKSLGNISVAYFGDGAIEEGVIFESLNLAKIIEAPMLFVVENNLYASHMHISERQPNMVTKKIAEANNINFSVVDGNDVCAVNKAAKEHINHCRNFKGPAFLELITYRYYGHVDWREDIDVGVTRSAQEVENWKKKDPIKRLFEAMECKDMITRKQYDLFIENIQNMIDEKWQIAMAAPFPKEQDLLTYVYHK